MPKDDDAIRALAGAAMNRGDYAACEKVYRQVIEELRPSASDYNNIAWNALLKRHEPRPRARRGARRR